MKYSVTFQLIIICLLIAKNFSETISKEGLGKEKYNNGISYIKYGHAEAICTSNKTQNDKKIIKYEYLSSKPIVVFITTKKQYKEIKKDEKELYLNDINLEKCLDGSVYNGIIGEDTFLVNTDDDWCFLLVNYPLPALNFYTEDSHTAEVIYAFVDNEVIDHNYIAFTILAITLITCLFLTSLITFLLIYQKYRKKQPRKKTSSFKHMPTLETIDELKVFESTTITIPYHSMLDQS